jgi:hypothetical protein
VGKPLAGERRWHRHPRNAVARPSRTPDLGLHLPALEPLRLGGEVTGEGERSEGEEPPGPTSGGARRPTVTAAGTLGDAVGVPPISRDALRGRGERRGAGVGEKIRGVWMSFHMGVFFLFFFFFLSIESTHPNSVTK